MELSTATLKRPAISNFAITARNQKPSVLTFTIDDFCDSILLEILHRVGTSQDSARCKAVCRRWRSLLSLPYYISLFVRSHARFCYYQTHGTVLLSFTNQQTKNPSIFVPINLDCYKSLDLTFSSIPERGGALKVVASCHDLLLLSGDKGLYVHNPLTRQSIAIGLISKGYVQYGLVTEPFYTPSRNENTSGNFDFNPDFDFAVICFTEEVDMGGYIGNVYCPRSGRKYSYILSGPNRNYSFGSNVIGCVRRKKLYWYNGSQVVAFDPFNTMGDDHTFFIDASALNLPLEDIEFCDHCIGLEGRQLKIMQLVVYSDENRENTVLNVWKLELTTARWSLEYRITFETLVNMNPWFHQFLTIETFKPRVLGFHPTDPDVVFMDLMKCVLLCSLRTSKLEFTGKMLTSASTDYNHYNTFSMVQPWWPSPLGFDAAAQNARNGGAFNCFTV